MEEGRDDESPVTGPVPSCPVCGEGMSGASLVACGRCRTPHHRDCFRYAGVCAVFACGCRSFNPLQKEPPGKLLELAEKLASVPRRQHRPARHQRPPAPVPAAVAADEPPPPGELVLDYLSPFELRARWLAALGFLSLGLLMLTGPCPHGFDPSNPLMVLAAIAGVVGLWLSYTVEDLLVFDRDSRTIVVDRTGFGLSARWPLHRFNEFTGVGLTGWSIEPTFSVAGARCPQLYWLVLVGRDGKPSLLGNPVSGAGDGQPPRRMLGRARAVTGLPETQVKLPAELVREAQARCSRPMKLLWFATTASLAAFGYDLALGQPLIWFPCLAAAGFALATWTFWWMIERPLAFGGEPFPVKPGVVRRALGGLSRRTRHRTGREEIGGLIMLLAALLGLPYLSHTFFTALRAQWHYSETRCRILDSGISVQQGNKGKSYHFRVRYAYTAGGQSLESNRFDLSPFPSTSESAARQALDRYLKNAEVPCWFDPADPRKAVLDPSLPLTVTGLLALSLFLVMQGAAAAVRWQWQPGGGPQ